MPGLTTAPHVQIHIPVILPVASDEKGTFARLLDVVARIDYPGYSRIPVKGSECLLHKGPAGRWIDDIYICIWWENWYGSFYGF